MNARGAWPIRYWERLWLPSKLLARGAPREERRRGRVLVWIVTVLPACIAATLAMDLLLGKAPGHAEWTIVAVLSSSVVLLPLLRRGLSVSVAAYLFSSLLTLGTLAPVYFSGGRALPALMTLSTFPAAAMVMLGLRGALFVCGLVVAGLAAIAGAQTLGYPATLRPVPEAVFQRWLLIVPMLVSIAVTTLMALLERSRRAALDEMRAYREQLEESETRLRAAFDAAPVGMGFFGADGTTLSANRVGREMLGLEPGQPVDEAAWLRCIHPEDKDTALRFFRLALRGQARGGTEYRWVRPDGKIEWTRAAASAVRHADGRLRFVVGTAEFVTQHREAEERIRQLAFFDEVTGLANRSLMVERLEIAVARARNSRHPLAVLFLDLDGFKKVNDTLGHDAGDLVLAQVAERFASCVRLSDQMSRVPDELHLSRFGGDEFVLLLSKVDGHEGCETVAKRLMASLDPPILVRGQQSELGVSIGIAVFPDHGDTVAELLRGADDAMYRAKRQPGSAYCFDDSAGSSEAPSA